ncbi:MAG: penicillin-insensitive murein endopeptidase [Candidatus Competibacteraceae bacterium]|nr:penicillin-insensitive murein endopeptidase [Candidatus Competibacteraceae bacterium]
MNTLMNKYLIALFLSLGMISSYAKASSWSNVRNPVSASPQSIGFYSAGCLVGGQSLPLKGLGFQVMRPSRNRYYGHPDLVAFVTRLARQAALRNDHILIGDLSQPRGGPMAYGHSSHQVGLDADIWFEPGPQGRNLSRSEIEKMPMRSTIVAAQGRVNPQRWSSRQRDLLKLAAEDPVVARIFVNPVIKQALCRSEGTDRAWLRKIRPWWGHDAHFHVRLHCPAGSYDCRDQKPPPPGDGCAEGVNQWVEEIRQAALNPPKFRPPAKNKRKSAVLPATCQTVLSGNWASQSTRVSVPSN